MRIKILTFNAYLTGRARLSGWKLALGYSWRFPS